MKEEKLRQLKTVFKTILKEMIKEVNEEDVLIEDYPSMSKSYADKLLYEVKIRINNK